MADERIWGRSIWVWRAQAALVLACLFLLVLSQTVSGRVFMVMVIVSQFFLAWSAYISWTRAERLRASDDTDWDDGMPWF